MRRLIHIFVLTFAFLSKSYSKHIVGGEIYYDKLSGNDYRITLKVYRDCLGGGAPFDGNGPNVPRAIVTIYETAGTLFDTIDIGSPIITNIPPTINNPCIQAPSGVCVEEGVYTTTITLPPKAGGYYLVYQRCCRNNSIINLVTPGNQGSTYVTKVPGPEDAVNNSSARFNLFPPIFLCNNVPFSFDHSATDPDGDLLVYSFTTPFQGLDANCPALGGAGCPTVAPPQPYTTVNYATGYSGNYPIASSPAFTIQQNNGLLSGRPNLIGQFVVGVKVQEIRNGKIINTHFRDFQFNVTSCVVQVVSVFADQKQKCEGTTISFINQSFGNLGALTYLWDFGVPNITSDTSSLINPTYSYPDTGRYEVTLIANPNKQCSDTLKKTFYVYPQLKTSFQVNKLQCLKNNSADFKNTSVHVNGASFNWNFGPAATPSVSVDEDPEDVVFGSSGSHTISLLVTQFTCRDSVTDSIRVFGRPFAKVNNLPSALCDPATVAFSNGSYSELPVGYKWEFSNGKVSTAFEPVQVFTPPGVYGVTLTATTSSICPDTSIASVKNITVFPTPEAGFTFSPQVTTIFDPVITFTNQSSDDVVYWYYDFNDGAVSYLSNNSHEYKSPGTYTVTQIVGNAFQCKDTARQEVKILPEFRFWIPNCFTPNGDGRNEVFMPKAIGVLDYEFEIYDKWGLRIFRTTDPQSGWDGTLKGILCKQDVYVWRITFKNEVTLKYETHHGIVTLLP